MVYFSCSGCNESLKKNKVVNHLSFCRRCTALTCLDCQQDFTRQTYISHNSCMTEVEKYGGPGYVQPANANKGLKKQMGWMDSVRTNINKFIEETKNDKSKKEDQILLTGLLQYDNIPRKKGKFINFVKSSFGRFRYNDPLIERVWEVVSFVNSETSNDSNVKETPENTNKKADAELSLPEPNETVDEEKSKNKEKNKKRKREEVDEEEEVSPTSHDAEDDDSRKKRKKKKRKRDEEEEEEELLPVSHDTDDDDSHKKRKKKKRKRDEVEEAEEELLPASHDTDDDDSHKKRKKKKSKKREKEENGIENGNTADYVENGDGSSRKKKSRKRDLDHSDEVSDKESENPAKKRSKKECTPEGFEKQRLNETLQEETPSKFVLSDVVTTIVGDKGDSGVGMKKLEKKVISRYLSSIPEGRPPRPHKISAKLKTVISKHFRVVRDRVFLRPEV